MLKEVGVQLAVAQGQVGLHVVGELDDLQVDAHFGKERLDKLQDFRMRDGRGADLDRRVGGTGHSGRTRAMIARMAVISVSLRTVCVSSLTEI